MPRRLLILFMFLTVALAACKSTNQTGTGTPGAGKTPKAAKTPVTTAGPTTTKKQAATLNVPAQPSVAGCTLVSFLPTPDPTSLFPAITEDDWHQGPMTATVKIIEYSDFQ